MEGGGGIFRVGCLYAYVHCRKDLLPHPSFSLKEDHGWAGPRFFGGGRAKEGVKWEEKGKERRTGGGGGGGVFF